MKLILYLQFNQSHKIRSFILNPHLRVYIITKLIFLSLFDKSIIKKKVNFMLHLNYLLILLNLFSQSYYIY